MKNSENSEFYSYPVAHPEIVTLYNNMAFMHSYNSARGHLYSLDDLYATGRVHPRANCYACKTPDFHAYANEVGVEAYNVPFDEMRSRISEPISCFNCHANEPGTLTVTHRYL